MERSLYLNHRNRVNTIFRFCESSSERRSFGEDAEMCTRGRPHTAGKLCAGQKPALTQGLGRVSNRYHRAGYNRSAVTDPKKLSAR
jgi:hypothetical protein